MLKNILMTSLLVAAVSGMALQDAQARSLKEIKSSGTLLVGTTGDYKPMSYLNKETGKYEGFDAEMAASLAKKLGVKTVVNFREADTLDKRVALVKGVTDNMGVDFAFQCTGAPPAAADVYSYIRRGGGLCLGRLRCGPRSPGRPAASGYGLSRRQAPAHGGLS